MNNLIKVHNAKQLRWVYSLILQTEQFALNKLTAMTVGMARSLIMVGVVQEIAKVGVTVKHS